MLKTRQITLDSTGQAVDHEGGGVLIMESNTDSGTVDITWLDSGGADAGTVKAARVGRKFVPGGFFAGYRINGAANAVVTVLIGDTGADATNEPNSDTSNPVPVFTVLGANLADVAPVAINDVGVLILAADATRRAVRLRNAGANPVALVALNATNYADAAVVLLPGETWSETDAARCAIRGKCDAGLASTINIQKVNT